ncbi:SRPBCC family protein [Flavobacteriaceae bacterium]|uniref:SRPBCC family protein n=1 Tax=Candidatus Arcticimaribacter forsetii TaxID=2820661 RepID=UPI0020779A44|nr:SRPBCC family protein [Candidatus Arcticimaribacter forsetii]MDA8699117.1 SRPBCC family protein [Flavobacteriaceae bacterium]MDB2345667.1 SRPBCC family protein [Flavobacteriaceae bacterium]MDB4674784.1 SRPBCC family protein [Flavobacteriaceae bacterium]MDB4717105.1 SRPBCC family protein [Flavobacteriaceae bacterium]
MHYIRFIIGVLFFIFLIFLLHIKNIPSEFKIKRTITTSIPAETLYKYIHDFEQWPEWNPWIQEDPEMKLTFDKTNSELPSYKWYGKEGSGSVKTITTDYPHQIKQVMLFDGFNPANISWYIKEDSNTLQWTMEGEMDFAMKIFTLMSGSMDSMIGPYYERGLKNINQILSNKLNEYRFKLIENESLQKQFYLNKTYFSKPDKIDSIRTADSKILLEYARENKLQTDGILFTLTPRLDSIAVTWKLALPIKEYHKSTNPFIKCRLMRERKSLSGIHYGPKDKIETSWNTLYKKIDEINPKLQYYQITRYIKDATFDKDPLSWETELILPYKLDF